ncbi:hypothetical protein FRC04_008593 [Tulasnella sp. 424]|nr:hypothetical protein FRC04_008593 [Tulasnella sp. 424]KAG8965691.1 hypothetical protein FRC05_003079 [Tulasnella sp. 425]
MVSWKSLFRAICKVRYLEIHVQYYVGGGAWNLVVVTSVLGTSATNTCLNFVMRTPQLKAVRSYFSRQTAPLLAVRSKLAAKESPTPQRQETQKFTLLPYDIILIVVEFLDERSTARWVQTCRHFRDLIEPVLYRHIQVFRTHEEETSDPLKCHLLHRTLVNRPDLIPFVLSYHGPFKPDILVLERVARDKQPTKRKSRWFKAKAETENPPEKVPTSEEVLKTADAIFRGMINLRDVHFTDQISFKTLFVLDYLKNLEKLALDIGGYSIYLVYALRILPRLKHLELLRAGGLRGLESTDVPELRSLKAPLFEASKIVPGRPIETLELLDDSWTYRSYSGGVAENLFKDLTLSACEITDFTIRFGCSGNDETVAEYLELAARYLPSIERLCISSRHTVSDSLLLEMVPAVSSLRHLKITGPVSRKETDATTVLHETQQFEDDIPLYCPEDFDRFVRRLKEHCHGLIEVEWCRSETVHCRAEGEIPFRYRAVE